MLLGAIGGSSISAPLAALLKSWPPIAGYANSLAFGIVVVLITTLTLLVGELIPKRLALHQPERIAAAISGPMMFISRLFTPLVWALGKITEFVAASAGHQAER